MTTQTVIRSANIEAAKLARIERGTFHHSDTRDIAVRFAGGPLRMSIVQAAELIEQTSGDLADRLRTDVACALREDFGISWERACGIAYGIGN